VAKAAFEIGTMACAFRWPFAALQDLPGALFSFHHAFGIEQHVAVLAGSTAAGSRADARDGCGWQVMGSVGRARHPYFAIASFMAHRMSSLNCSTSSARSCWRAS
jgi:hypothetical protein